MRKKTYSKEWLTVEEWDRLSGSVKEQKHNTMLSLLYGCALRVSELCSLRVRDIDPVSSRLIIRKSKRSKDPVIIPIPKSVLEKIRLYVQTYSLQPDNYLIFTRNKNSLKPVHRKTIYRRIKHLATKAEIEKPITCHTFRRSRATHLLDAGLPLERVSQLLRHSKIGLTQIYLKLAPAKLQEELRKVDPLEKTDDKDYS